MFYCITVGLTILRIQTSFNYSVTHPRSEKSFTLTLSIYFSYLLNSCPIIHTSVKHEFPVAGIDKMIVRARPLSKLCEFDGQPLPEDYKSDCYHDVDESEFACKEKARIMVRDFK